jgi:hypothetical protein
LASVIVSGPAGDGDGAVLAGALRAALGVAGGATVPPAPWLPRALG